MVAGVAGAEALGVAAVFHKAELFVQGKGAGVIGYHIQLQLGVASLAGAVDAGGGECLANAKAAVLRRGKNASKATVAKHATVQEYRASTGFECLLGWLYLQGRNDRIQELFDALWEGYQPE